MSRNKSFGQFIRFSLVGASNTLIDFGVLNLLVWFFRSPHGVGLLLCNATGFACANLNSFYLNKNWTFNDRQSASLGLYGTFFWLSLIGLGISTLILWLLADLLAPTAWSGHLLWINFAKLVALVAGLTWNYLTYRYLVFK